MQVNQPPVVETEVAVAHIALVRGEPLLQLPQDLYIPPDALEIFLDAFEGPLDLLLYLIKRQNLDILNIPILAITEQYMGYIAIMENMRFELAAEYLLMAAMLAEIKSRMLLPRVEEDAEDEDDPRAELIRRLLEYERIKETSEKLDDLPRMEREHFQLQVVPPKLKREIPQPELTLKELLMAFKDVAARIQLDKHHNVNKELLSVRARMSAVLSALNMGEFCEFATLFDPEEGRLGVVVTFLAVLELCKEFTIDLVQAEPFAPIYLKVRGSATAASNDEQLNDGAGETNEQSDDDLAAEDDSFEQAEPEETANTELSDALTMALGDKEQHDTASSDSEHSTESDNHADDSQPYPEKN